MEELKKELETLLAKYIGFEDEVEEMQLCMIMLQIGLKMWLVVYMIQQIVWTRINLGVQSVMIIEIQRKKMVE